MASLLIAIVPVFALLILGNIARRSGFLADSFWREAEKATYYILFPALLVKDLAKANVDYTEAGLLLALAAAIPLVATVLCFMFKPWLRLNGADFTSFFQGGIRFNTFMGLALVAATLPAQAMPMAAILIAVMIPLINLLCIAVFARYAQGQLHTHALLLAIVKNSLIVACVLGVILHQLPFTLPTVLWAVLDKLAQMALPVGLLAVGAGLHLQALRASGITLLGSSLIKLLVLPALFYGVCRWLQLDAVMTSVVVTFAALPTASSAYILARQLGGNAAMMAVLITGQTLLSLFTLPLILLWVRP